MLVHVTYPKANGKDTRKLYFSTDVSMDPSEVLLYYHSRFQFNASLISINIAKAIHWLSVPKEEREALTSLSSQARLKVYSLM